MYVTDLSNISFLIPIALDCQERTRNLRDQLLYLRQTTARISICESDTHPIVPELFDLNGINYSFVKRSGPFHRTRLLNLMARDAKTSIIVLHDTDIRVPYQQMSEAAAQIIEHACHFCYPFESFVHVNNFEQEESSWITPGSFGGSIFCDREAFYAAGMENEKFMSWGAEDCERYERWKILGYTIKRLPGNVYHAEHPRGLDSGGSNPHYQANLDELRKVAAMSSGALKAYISDWPWLR